MSKVQSKILIKLKHNLVSMPSAQCKTPEVSFIVHKDGHVTDTKIVSSSGDAAIDKVAVQAISDSFPFDPLPPGSAESVTMQMGLNFRYSPPKVPNGIIHPLDVDTAIALSGKYYQPYVNYVHERVRQYLAPMAKTQQKLPMVTFTISADGHIPHVTVVISSGNTKVDLAAVTALKSACPFKPYPLDELMKIIFIMDLGNIPTAPHLGHFVAK